jgi:hypothetical protein
MRALGRVSRAGWHQDAEAWSASKLSAATISAEFVGLWELGRWAHWPQVPDLAGLRVERVVLDVPGDTSRSEPSPRSDPGARLPDLSGDPFDVALDVVLEFVQAPQSRRFEGAAG